MIKRPEGKFSLTEKVIIGIIIALVSYILYVGSTCDWSLNVGYR